MSARPNAITDLLRHWSTGDAESEARLVEAIYPELRRLAARHLAGERAALSLETTDLVHEAWMRLCADGEPEWESKAHFFGAAANAMRNILVEQARRKRSLKRDASRRQELGTDLPAIAPIRWRRFF